MCNSTRPFYRAVLRINDNICSTFGKITISSLCINCASTTTLVGLCKSRLKLREFAWVRRLRNKDLFVLCKLSLYYKVRNFPVNMPKFAPTHNVYKRLNYLKSSWERGSQRTHWDAYEKTLFSYNYKDYKPEHKSSEHCYLWPSMPDIQMNVPICADLQRGDNAAISDEVKGTHSHRWEN